MAVLQTLNLLYTDMADSGLTLGELTVFQEYYALLHNMITDIVGPLMKCFVEQTILTTEEETHFSAITAATEKLKLLLLKISSCLKAGDTRSFHMMLTIMREHGGKGTQTLANHIMKRLKFSTDQLPNIYGSGNCMQSKKAKGLR